MHFAIVADFINQILDQFVPYSEEANLLSINFIFLALIKYY
jgi:hypothetical protein